MDQYFVWKRVQSTTACPMRRCGAVKGEWCDRAEFAGKVHRVRAYVAGVTEFDLPHTRFVCDNHGLFEWIDRKESVWA